MILSYAKEDDDLKFLFHHYDRGTTFMRGCLAYNGKEGLEPVVEELFRLAGEEFDQKKLAEFRRVRSDPSPARAASLGTSVLGLLNYICIVRSTIVAGTLRHREYIAEFSRRLGDIGFDPEFYLLDIRAGLIASISDVEGMDKLYCEKVRAGREYTVCSGLRTVYKKEELLGGVYLFLLNIKKARFRGLESEGMICCTEGHSIEAIGVKKKEGTGVELEGFLPLFEDIEYGKVDLAKTAYKRCLAEFRIVDHHLTFKGRRVLCGGEYVRTETENGDVR